MTSLKIRKSNATEKVTKLESMNLELKDRVNELQKEHDTERQNWASQAKLDMERIIDDETKKREKIARLRASKRKL